MGERKRKTLREVMTPVAITLSPDHPVRDAAQKMAIARVGCVLVVDDDNALVGLFTERDLLRMFTTTLEPPLTDPVSEHMSRYPLTLGPEEPIDSGERFMRKNMIGHLPVVEDGHLVGIVALRDFAN